MKSSLYEHYKQKYKVGGKTPTRKTGMWYRDGDVIVPSNQITMKGPQGQLDYFDSPIMGTGMQSGQTQVMQPGGEYFFPKDKAVYERMMQKGGEKSTEMSPEQKSRFNAYMKTPATKSLKMPEGLQSLSAEARARLTKNLNVQAGYKKSADQPGQFNVGLSYNKSFQAGGMSIPGVNGSIVASLPDSPKESIRKAYMKKGGQHGGLDRWFAEKWVDVKSGKPCGRQEGENRAYPACRPSKRVNSKTPKTSSELSSSEKSKFKSSKTSSQRISYNHKRK